MRTYVYSLPLFALFACSASTPPNLVQARASYQRAMQGPAARLTPAQLHVAQTSLAVAEKTYDDEGDTPNARDRAYVAQRKAELAEVQAGIVDAELREAMARKQVQENNSRAQLATQQNLDQAQVQIAGQRAELVGEKQRREEAERRAAEAMAQLASIASIKKESRGTVITLSGAVIFASGKSDLLPPAREKLNQVATALKQNDSKSTFLVQGYTDSRGSLNLNQDLSTRRAAAVRSYLVSQGVPEDRIKSEGLGPSNPVADNGTAEGRANNRRVEIIVQNQASGNDQRRDNVQSDSGRQQPPQQNQQHPQSANTNSQSGQKMQ
jgi:outer membrane protein OmpA-like peptidoglycan-associated protein